MLMTLYPIQSTIRDQKSAKILEAFPFHLCPTIA